MYTDNIHSDLNAEFDLNWISLIKIKYDAIFATEYDIK